MYIKSIVLEGFKSYAQRTEVNGFDPLFNAITGLNGSGKSNILDSICFLLGISNLSQVKFKLSDLWEINFGGPKVNRHWIQNLLPLFAFFTLCELSYTSLQSLKNRDYNSIFKVRKKRHLNDLHKVHPLTILGPPLKVRRSYRKEVSLQSILCSFPPTQVL